MRSNLHRSLFPVLKEKENYYRNFIVKDSLESTVQTLTRRYTDIRKTFQDITFNELPWGSSEKEIARRLGPPRYKFQKVNDLEKHLIMFFKIEIGGQNAILQCHLFDNELYFLNIDFVNSLYKDVRFIEEIIHNKYSEENFDSNKTTCFEDYFQNKLVVDHNVYMNIFYMSGKTSVIQKFEKELYLFQNNRKMKIQEKKSDFFKLL